MRNLYKKVASFMLALAIMMSAVVPAFAADNWEPSKIQKATAIADVLYEAGLFYGIGKDANGNPVYDLESNATRAQAIVMLVRILGKEAESATASKAPFVDVPDWAQPSVNYAYSQGLTGGTSPTTFSSEDLVTNTQYITFCLRALGYNEKDFKWDEAHKLAYDLGALEKGSYDNASAPCSRADMVLITYAILNTKIKTGNGTLADKLGVTLETPITPGRPSLEECIPERYLGVVDTSDPNNYRPDQYGNIHFREAFGYNVWSCLINRYNSNLTPLENMENFSELVNGMNNVKTEVSLNGNSNGDGEITFNLGYAGWNSGYVWAYNASKREYQMAAVPMNTWDDKKPSGFWGDFDGYGYAFHKQVLSFFDYDMAVRLYAMITDYHYNTDSWTEPVEDGVDEAGLTKYKSVYHGSQYLIDENFANKYGLTYVDGGENDYPTNYVVVSNGNMTVKVEYNHPGVGYFNKSIVVITWSY